MIDDKTSLNQQSYLGSIYSKIRGSQEDVASGGIVYVLDRSAGARSTLSRFVASKSGVDLGELTFKIQTTGEDLERPDISCYNCGGNEVAIIEAKFWAALTHNQPVSYLKRLPANGCLLFMVPNLRVDGVKIELLERLEKAGLEHSIQDDDRTILVNQTQKMVIVTWDEILNVIREKLIEAGETNLKSDIDQVIGLCKAVDTDSYIPITEDEISPMVARNICKYNDLLDSTVQALKAKGVDFSGSKMTSAKNIYLCYFTAEGRGFSVYVNYLDWARLSNSPFWMGPTTNTPGFKKVALKTPYGLAQDEAAKYLADQVIMLAKNFIESEARERKIDLS